MSFMRNLSDSRNAFQNAGVNDLLFPVSDEQRIKLQKTVLDIFIDIQTFCIQNEIVPFLVGGSALGAIRHHGFIPWDDDLDIGMIRSQYDKFIIGFEEEYRDKYIVNSAGKDKNAKVRFTKVMKKGTICKEIVAPDDDSLNGVFVDIFPIDNVPNNKLLRFFKGHYCNALEFISSQVFYKEFENEEILQLLRKTGKFSYIVRRIVGKLFSYKSSSDWFAKLDKAEQYKDDKSNYCSIVPGRKHYFGEIFDRNIIFPERYVEFDGISAPVFGDVESYLKNLYGDYMKIPPVEKREKHMLRELKI